MDNQFNLAIWACVIIGAILLGGPVLMLMGMFFLWLLPGIIVGSIVLIALRMWGRALDRHTGRR